ncbi:MAG: phosphoribosyltransferase [Promethearchaeota archaeon]|nr:MAG: phosphoribosyltransferase [Candidatus Lokiarchaeota archaeon]
MNVMSVVPYESRFSVGKILGKLNLKKNNEISGDISKNSENYYAFAIPNGGVPVAEGFCSVLNVYYDLLIVRKIKIPYNPEAGFGSITTDGTIILNENLLSQLHLKKNQIDNAIKLTKKEIQERLKFYEKDDTSNREYKNKIYGKIIFLLDDGLASGYTMLAAVNMIKAYKPKKIIISVPTAPLRTIRLFDDKVNHIECPNVRKTTWFAVADAYKHWYDISESEVKDIIQKSQYYQ